MYIFLIKVTNEKTYKFFFFFQAEDGIRDFHVTGVQTCALPICVFNTLIRWLVLPGLQDTQCGFKCIRADVARDIFPYQTLTGWAFDVELLYIARRHGYRVVEIPI